MRVASLAAAARLMQGGHWSGLRSSGASARRSTRLSRRRPDVCVDSRVGFFSARDLAARDCIERAVRIRVLLQIFPSINGGSRLAPIVRPGPGCSGVATATALRLFAAGHCFEIRIANVLSQKSISVGTRAFPQECYCIVSGRLLIVRFK
jgi:hypothetical protein